MAEYGEVENSFTRVTATPGIGRIPQRRAKTRWALPAPTNTTCFSMGTIAPEGFINAAWNLTRRTAECQRARILVRAAIYSFSRNPTRSVLQKARCCGEPGS